MSVMQNRCSQRALAFAACLGILLPLVATPAQESTDRRPPAPRRSSVVLILADGIGCDDLGCYGSTRTKTPNLDRLAKEGARFSSFYAASPADSVSRAALMLGLHTGHLNVRDDSSHMILGGRDVTFSQLLRASGYSTTLSGLWGLGNGTSGKPHNKGFEQFAGFMDDVKPVDDYPEFIHRHQPASVVDTEFDGQVQLLKNAQGKQGQHVVDVLTEVAMNAARINKPEHYNQYRPFFLMLAYPFPKSAGESQTDRDRYITRMDAAIGQLLDKLEALKIEANTIVMFSGGGAARKRTGSTNRLSDADLRVPFIVRWPARLAPVTVSEPWATWDILPTMMSIARRDSPTNIDGISFYTTLLSQEQTNHHDYLYWESHDHEQGFQQAARTKNWKAVRLQAGEKLELYDLNSDPAEKTDVAEKHPEVVEMFEKYFKSARTESEQPPAKKSEKDPAAGDKQPSTS